MKSRPSLLRVLFYYLLFVAGTNFVFKKLEQYHDKKNSK